MYIYILHSNVSYTSHMCPNVMCPIHPICVLMCPNMSHMRPNVPHMCPHEQITLDADSQAWREEKERKRQEQEVKSLSHTRPNVP